MFLQKLRSETEALHKSLEQNAISARLVSDHVTLTDYSNYLEKLYGFIAAFEHEFAASLSNHFPFIPITAKANLLAQDLTAMNIHVDQLVIMPSSQMHQLYSSVYEQLGGWYVLEGSSLGGMVLKKHLESKLGPVSTAYFNVYGERTGTTWKAFLQQLNTIAAQSNAEAQVISGAVKTFRSLKEWME